MTTSDLSRGENAVTQVYELAREISHNYPTAEVEKQRHTKRLEGETEQGRQKTLSVVTIAFPKTVEKSQPSTCKDEVSERIQSSTPRVDGEQVTVTQYLPHTVDIEVPDARAK